MRFSDQDKCGTSPKIETCNNASPWGQANNEIHRLLVKAPPRFSQGLIANLKRSEKGTKCMGTSNPTPTYLRQIKSPLEICKHVKSAYEEFLIGGGGMEY